MRGLPANLLACPTPSVSPSRRSMKRRNVELRRRPSIRAETRPDQEGPQDGLRALDRDRSYRVVNGSCSQAMECSDREADLDGLRPEDPSANHHQIEARARETPRNQTPTEGHSMQHRRAIMRQRHLTGRSRQLPTRLACTTLPNTHARATQLPMSTCRHARS